MKAQPIWLIIIYPKIIHIQGSDSVRLFAALPSAMASMTSDFCIKRNFELVHTPFVTW
jgi:hypothetical protein